jgi:hypothetical protein
MPPTTTSSAPVLAQQQMQVDVIKQHPGPTQVLRRVLVNVPGKHFPAFHAREQSTSYIGTAVEFKERHKFFRLVKAWGAEHTGPGIIERYNLKFRSPIHKKLLLASAGEASSSAVGSSPGAQVQSRPQIRSQLRISFDPVVQLHSCSHTPSQLVWRSALSLIGEPHYLSMEIRTISHSYAHIHCVSCVVYYR